MRVDKWCVVQQLLLLFFFFTVRNNDAKPASVERRAPTPLKPLQKFCKNTPATGLIFRVVAQFQGGCETVPFGGVFLSM
jgi:hypothetical protein